MTNSILSDKRLRIFFIVWWIVCASLQYIILIQVNIDKTHAVTDSIISNVLLATSCFFISNNMKYYLPRQEKYWYILVVSLTVSFFWMLAQQAIMWIVFKEGDNYNEVIHASWGIRFGSGFLLISSMSMFSLLWYSQQEQKEMHQRKTETEKLTKEAELFKLRQQLQPHFLFNSLNSISALTGSNPEKARHMIHQLSDFLRGTLKKHEQQWNTLKEELQYLQLYLDIEKVRFGHRLQTEIIFKEEILHFKLPALLLQPVVENAIKFGLYDTTGEVLIKLDAIAEGNNLKIIVQNPFDPETAQPMKGTGFGLSSIQRRLFLLFARNDLLKTKKDKEYFITTILVPQTEELKSSAGSTKSKLANQIGKEINDQVNEEIMGQISNKINETLKKKFK
ncbi:MAG: histidine kinase [Bacteroidota bacterium]|nr:histidine kinase [Bacteroidota bacterium]